jgi:hypothetical protein
MSDDFMSVLQDFIPEVNPSQKCHINTGPILILIFNIPLCIYQSRYEIFLIKKIYLFLLQFSISYHILRLFYHSVLLHDFN